MITQETLTLFNTANDLWFDEGYTADAVEVYKKALQLSNNHPILAYQLAFCLSSLGKLEEARSYLSIMDHNKNLLGEEGQENLEELKLKIVNDVDDDKNHYLDIKQLEKDSLTKDEWFEVAVHAQTRDIMGVALRAYKLSSREFLDLDLVHDEEEVRQEINIHRKRLRRLLAESNE